MAPAGSYEALYAAINAGADAVYFGAGLLNMRSNSSANFVVEDIQKIAAICSENNVKSYITLNTVIYDQDLETMEELLKTAKEAGVSAVIASDWAVIDFAHKIGLPVHCSTQLNISNSRALNYYSKYSDVIVLARKALPSVSAIAGPILICLRLWPASAGPASLTGNGSGPVSSATQRKRRAARRKLMSKRMMRLSQKKS